MPPKKTTATKTAKKKETSHHDSSDLDEVESVNNVNNLSNTPITLNIDQPNKKSKAFNMDLFNLLDKLNKSVETLNKNKDEFSEQIKKVEGYNFDKFAEIENDFEVKEKEFYDRSESLNKSYDEMKAKLARTYEEMKNKLEKEDKERRYKIEKEYDEKEYELEKDFEKKKYDNAIEHQKTVDEMQRKRETDAYKFCVDYLKQKGEQPIKVTEWNEKNEKLENLISKHEESLEDLEEKLKEKHERELKYELEKKDLTQKSEVATLKAENDQKDKQIKVLESTIASLKSEIADQRALTKHVAEAGRQGQIVQNMGSSK
jgi:chromosome segregation ATPase